MWADLQHRRDRILADCGDHFSNGAEIVPWRELAALSPDDVFLEVVQDLLNPSRQPSRAAVDLEVVAVGCVFVHALLDLIEWEAQIRRARMGRAYEYYAHLEVNHFPDTDNGTLWPSGSTSTLLEAMIKALNHPHEPTELTTLISREAAARLELEMDDPDTYSRLVQKVRSYAGVFRLLISSAQSVNNSQPIPASWLFRTTKPREKNMRHPRLKI